MANKLREVSMAREQTVFSELAVASGICDSSIEAIANVDNTAIDKFKSEQAKRKESKDSLKTNSEVELRAAGALIRDWLISDKKIATISVDWIAGDATKDGSPVAKDLMIKNTDIRISVKENAQLFQNPSPVQVFQKWPQGVLFTNAKDGDWFVKVASKELNEYFTICDGQNITGQKSVEDYYKNVKGYETKGGKQIKKRKAFTEHVAALHAAKAPNVLASYKKFCTQVSQESAKIFNENIATTFPKIECGEVDLVLLTNLFSVFFKMDNTEYVLAGTENGKSFAVVVHDIEAWQKKFLIKKIQAEALNAGQPEVAIKFDFIEKSTNKQFTYGIKCEVRWSHGKFCGNPESKLYKHNNWKYEELPWIKVL